jgi:membrane associated rhomboid family serine protease
MLHNEDSNSQLPPSSNPILDRYLEFRNGTPFVTRLMLASQVTCYILSFLVDTQKVTANIPYFTVYYFQIYRILLSPLLCNRFLSLAIAFLSFSEPGRRLERSIGSTAFLCLVTTLATLTNATYIIFAFLLCELTGNKSLLYQQASGIWLVVFGIITIECHRAPPQSSRRLVFFPVRVEYFPFALFAFFCFFTGTFEWSYIISIGIGYAHEYVR